jgi:predicted AAA+ superfamily ATPase
MVDKLKIKRNLQKEIAATKKSVLLLGPRQVGKSTLMHSLNPDVTINLAKENEFLRFSANIDLFVDLIEGSNAKLVFIDEVQRIPGILNSVQAIIDESKGKRALKFLITGSSARKLRRGQANLLPGRILSFQLGGLTAAEMDYKIDLAKALKHGFLPEPFLESSNKTAEKLLESYAAIYLKEEIQAEAVSRNIQGFARFLMLLASSSGQVVDYSKLATKAKVSRTSCIRFTEILEDTLVAHRIFSFDGSPKADTIKHPKLYFFDPGVLNGLLNNFNVSEDRKGILFEHLIYSQIRNSALAKDLPINIQFFRTRNGLEVDFVIELKDELWAIEVKSTDATDQDLKGLKAFHEYFPKTQHRVLVTPKDKKRQKNGILICNWIDLLKEMGL